MTIIDVAGGPTGGAARWRREAVEWLARHPGVDVRLIGQDHRVEPRWLARRELLGLGQRRIASNNVSFLTGEGPRIVLLVNALHFLRSGEEERLPAMPRGMARQIPIVRAASRRADVLIVPCTDMLERVVETMPWAQERIQVRHHPITVRYPRRPYDGRPFLLFPSLPVAHKDLTGSLSLLLESMRVANSPLQVWVTTTTEHLGGLDRDPRVQAIGPQTLDQMDQLWATTSAVFAPTDIESFGYPVAEARALGLPVLAIDSPRNREIGGKALVCYCTGGGPSLADAVGTATFHNPSPEPDPFEPDAYFDWLVSTTSI